MTETIDIKQFLSSEDWDTREPSQEETAFNKYWNVLYHYFENYEMDEPQHYSVATSLKGLVTYLDKMSIFLRLPLKENNLKSIQLLEEWLVEPDECGEEFWEEFREDLQKNRFGIS